MKTTYIVATRFWDRFAGLPLYPGYTVSLSDANRTVAFANDKGAPISNELHSPSDEDFAFIKGMYDGLIKDGTLRVSAPKKPVGPPSKPDAPKPEAKTESPSASEPVKDEAPKAEEAKPEAKTDDQAQVVPTGAKATVTAAKKGK